MEIDLTDDELDLAGLDREALISRCRKAERDLAHVTGILRVLAGEYGPAVSPARVASLG